MGDHASESRSIVRGAGYWALAHRRKIASAVIVALPLVARLWPEFPASDIASLVRTYLGV